MHVYQDYDLFLQEAVAQGLLRDYELMGQPECYFSSLAVELEGKRDRMAAILQDVGMSPIIPEGGYFMCVDVTPLSKIHFYENSTFLLGCCVDVILTMW
jgi:hypothetical protein